MMKKNIAAAILLFSLIMTGCSGDASVDTVKNSDPVDITIWHYYNGSQKAAFDDLVNEFNETVGKEKNIYVEGHSKGNVSELENAVLASSKKEVGSDEMPSIFSSYADTAYELEKEGLLADLSPFFTEEEQNSYMDAYIEEGKIGVNGELKIFPVAKSTEIMMMNKNVWDEFSAETGASLDDLKTKEGVVRVAGLYYDWTDAKTPDTPNDGKAFYGRDAVANLFIVGSMQLGTEIFHVEKQKVTLQIDRDVFKRIWDCYYVPFVKGYFAAYGRFRSDDVKIGELIAYTGSTTSAGYFPDQVEVGDSITPIGCIVLPVPGFEGGKPYIVQQGAGMVVTKSTQEKESAACEFLKWFTDAEKNTEFSCSSGYLPVKKDAGDIEVLEKVMADKQVSMPEKEYDTLTEAYKAVKSNELYTNKAFDGGSKARKVLEYDLSDKAVADREQVKTLLAEGLSLEDAVKDYISEESFDLWFSSVKQKLEACVEGTKTDQEDGSK
ncbi:extracellular solute-binding protein [Clostridium transplantifaecale]|uniref:extracellular solute-binding protein n=1 Tax=Clostridium transplantifaecale TaxID=2479838 RepID=UPI001FAB1A33|nr:extracellular solute-binding protein [Clostridium transplantifaecale]